MDLVLLLAALFPLMLSNRGSWNAAEDKARAR